MALTKVTNDLLTLDAAQPSITSTGTLTGLTVSGEITANGGIAIPDSVGATFGAGDLTIYHSGAHSYIQDTGTGNLYVGASALVSIASGDLQEIYATFNDDGAVSLRHDNSIKLTTTATGITVTDNLIADGVGIGTSSPRSLLDLGNGSSGDNQISWHTDSTTSYGNIWTSKNGGRTIIAQGLKGSSTVANGFEASTSSTFGRSAIEQDYGMIKFYTNAETATTYGAAYTPTERLKIDASGNVLIADGTALSQLIGGIGAGTTGGSLDWNNASNARSGSGRTLLNGTATNGNGVSALYHPFSFAYTNTGNMTQWAIGYNTNARYQRWFYGGSWSSWYSF